MGICQGGNFLHAAATYETPIAPARGIETVIVNGSIVWRMAARHDSIP